LLHPQQTFGTVPDLRSAFHAPFRALTVAATDTRALQHYLGHKSIQHTVRYTKLSPDRFHDFWRD
jgi:type 1 fimbriae regulatory protein FimB/type 1 fimbriae regulatory protein FimE